jgi:hypothetical protein
MIFQYLVKALPPLLCVIFLSSCTLPYLQRESCDTIPKSEDFPIAITRWETIAKEHTDAAKKAPAHLRLALLYSHYKNLNPDYLTALNELETYVNLDKERSNTDEIQNLLALLRSLKAAGEENKRLASERERLPHENQKKFNGEKNHEKLKSELERFSKENQEMKIKMEQLIKENQEIKKTVEELKHLDINIEEKRRQIK